jgi:hypothetical protein
MMRFRSSGKEKQLTEWTVHGPTDRQMKTKLNDVPNVAGETNLTCKVQAKIKLRINKIAEKVPM